jgi:predicted AlkP superfamily phosphohydrolase/phosphomutase
MPASVLAIGIDSCSATLLERWADAGHLPHFAAFRQSAADFRLRADCMETLPGAIWGDITSGEPAWRHGQYYQFDQWYPEEGLCRPLHEAEIAAGRTFWAVAATAGRRCAVVDAPFMPIIEDFPGIQIREYAVHDHWAGAAARPASLLDRISSRDGQQRLAGWCDARVGEVGRGAVCRELLGRAQCKTALLRDLLGQEHWDLFFGVYGETHCAAHQLWPQRAVSARGSLVPGEDIWAPLRDIYTRVDEGFGALLAEAGPAASVVLFTSHGVGPYLGGPQILPEFLRRLGLSDGWDWPGRRTLRNFAVGLRNRIEVRTVDEVPVVGGSFARAVAYWVGTDPHPAHRARCRAFTVPNNRIGAIRLKIAGRDHGGMVRPSEAETLLKFITRELEALEDPVSGERVVRRVQRSAELFGEDRSSLLPDLLVKFRTDIGRIEHVRSPCVGTIRVSNERPGYRRRGDHVPQSRAWIRAPGFARSAKAQEGSVLDLAPTILALLGVAPGSHMTGDILPHDGHRGIENTSRQ